MSMTTNKLNVCHINIRSLSDVKIDALKADILENHGILCLTETNLPHARVGCLNLPGFQHIIAKNRVDRQGGGVAIYVADHILELLE